MIPDSEAIFEQFGSQARYNDHRVTVDMVTVAKKHCCLLNHTTNEICKKCLENPPYTLNTDGDAANHFLVSF